MASKVGKAEWKILYVIFGFIDLIQIIIDLFIVGIVINEIADIIIGVIIIIYFELRGVPMIKHPKRLLSLLGIAGLEELTGGLAPAWIIDIWYIHKTVRQEGDMAEPEMPEGITLPRNQRKPVNSTPGIRPPRNI